MSVGIPKLCPKLSSNFFKQGTRYHHSRERVKTLVPQSPASCRFNQRVLRNLTGLINHCMSYIDYGLPSLEAVDGVRLADETKNKVIENH